VSSDAARPCIAYVLGTRPNFVKMAPVIAELKREAPDAGHVIIHTGQHYDNDLSAVFFDELSLPAPDYLLDVGSGPHGQQTGRALERIEAALLETAPDVIIVPGDVNSTLAGALAAVKLHIPIAHLEAGLRSFDRSMPEEVNRLLVDQISRWCFTHSPEAEMNLIREGVARECIYFVGNTMIDTLVLMTERFRRSDVLVRLRLQKHGYLLATLHRPALIDGPLFERVLAALALLSHDLPVVFPMHPRSRARLSVSHERPDSLHLVPPLPYVDFLALEANARAVITDSGGVQEETTYLGVPCFTLRDNTERPITISHGTNRLLGLQPEALERIPALLDEVPRYEPARGWDGRASRRVAEVLLRDLDVPPAHELLEAVER
jgi:UDP-N-acetylglucosamine 2-epimerase (non-hydrolysing)